MSTISEVPIVADDLLRRRLVTWVLEHAHAWKLQADGLSAWSAPTVAQQALAKAAVCEQMARDLEGAALTLPQSWKPFIRKEQS
jgi:hypothetical protein